MNRKQIFAGVLACALLTASLAGCGKKDAVVETTTPAGTPVEVQKVETGEMAAQNALTGTVQAETAIQVFPLLSGTVTQLNVSEGDVVTQGQLLFQVDTSTVTSTYAALQQSYNATKEATDKAITSAQLAVENAKLGIDQATTALENTRAMHEIGAASDQQLTQAEQGLQQAQTGLAQAQAGVEQALASQKASLAQIQASMTQITAQADLGTVTAPVSGLVTMVNIDRGGLAGQTAPAVVIAQDSKVNIVVSVSETVLPGLHLGDAAAVTLPSVSSESMTAAISSIASAANQQTKLYDVKLTLPEDVVPPIGAFANVVLYTDRRENAVYVPTEAILTDGESQYVYILTDQAPADDTAADGETAAPDAPAADIRAAKKIIVTTGLIGDGITEVTEGLTGGETLVVKGQSYLSDGAAARIVTREA